MKKFLFSLVTASLIVGCSSSTSVPNLDQMSLFSGGQRMGDATSYYWYTEGLNQPRTASDYVVSETYGWYKTTYRWEDGTVREVMREGEQLKDNALVPYNVHMRFNKSGEAVYQQYRVDKKILPLNEGQLDRYVLEAQAIKTMTKDQDKQGVELIQGIWDGETFESCTGKDYTHVEFNHSLPNFVMSRLASLDSYVGFLGKIRNNTVYIEELLILADDSHDCIERPELLAE